MPQDSSLRAGVEGLDLKLITYRSAVILVPEKIAPSIEFTVAIIIILRDINSYQLTSYQLLYTFTTLTV